MAPAPIARFNRWLAAAHKAGAPLAEAAALATVDSRHRPSVRYVLLKAADARGFVFYTNLESRKGRDLARNPNASLALYWDATGRQVRIDGRVELVDAAEANAYWSATAASESDRLSHLATERAVVIARGARRRVPRRRSPFSQ